MLKNKQENKSAYDKTQQLLKMIADSLQPSCREPEREGMEVNSVEEVKEHDVKRKETNSAKKRKRN